MCDTHFVEEKMREKEKEVGVISSQKVAKNTSPLRINK